MSAQSKIYISYARREGAELARRLEADLTTNGFDVVARFGAPQGQSRVDFAHVPSAMQSLTAQKLR